MVDIRGKDGSPGQGMTPRRLESLADGIFAFAMTLLVLSINLPDPLKNLDLGAFLSGQYNNFWNFALSFLLLSIFWINHSQQFHHVKRIDGVILWANIVLLLFVALIPFSTTVMNDYSSNVIAEAFFNSNMLIIYSILAFNWIYCCRKDLIELSEGRAQVSLTGRREIAMVIVPLAALVASFFYPGWSTLAYLFTPVIFLSIISRRK